MQVIHPQKGFVQLALIDPGRDVLIGDWTHREGLKPNGCRPDFSVRGGRATEIVQLIGIKMPTRVAS